MLALSFPQRQGLFWGLYAFFCISVIVAFVGGQPGMISAATGAMALLMVTLVKDHGLEYLLAATLLTGVLQIVAGYLKLGELMRFVSRSVVAEVEVIGLNEASATIVDRFGVHDKPDAVERLMDH